MKGDTASSSLLLPPHVSNTLERDSVSYFSSQELYFSSVDDWSRSPDLLLLLLMMSLNELVVSSATLSEMNSASSRTRNVLSMPVRPLTGLKEYHCATWENKTRH